ncbi:MAG: Fic family protein [Flavobacteriaceae bacterium]|nr:Fic family protein [Flavobacteriaceae bacterium]
MNKEFEELVREYQRISKGVINHDRYNLYAISCHSTGIEGSKLNIDDVNILLEYNISPKGTSIEHNLMVQDHHEALKDVLEMAKQKHMPKLGLNDLQRLSPKILWRTLGFEFAKKGNLSILEGRLRTVPLQAGKRVFMEAENVPTAVDVFLKDFNEHFHKQKTITDIYRFSFKAHYDLVDIHPFRDGNGRLSRLIMSFVQKFYELPMSIVNSNDKEFYFRALEKTNEVKTYEYLYDFMFEQASVFFQQEIDFLLQKKDINVVRVKAQNLKAGMIVESPSFFIGKKTIKRIVDFRSTITKSAKQLPHKIELVFTDNTKTKFYEQDEIKVIGIDNRINVQQKEFNGK